MLKTRIVPNDLILALNTKLSTVPCVYIEYLPPTPTFSSILRSAVFEIEGYEISEMHRMITDWPLNCQKACRIHRIFTPKGHFLSVSPIRPAVSWYKVVENRKCTEWLQSELWLNCQKYTCTLYTLNTYPRMPKYRSLLLDDPWLVFEMTAVFCFPFILQEWTWNFRETIFKKWTLKISKKSNSTFARTLEKKIKEQFGIIWKRLEGGVAFWHFSYKRVPC